MGTVKLEESKVKGVIVYPSAVDGVITGFVPRVTGEFRIVLDAPLPDEGGDR